MKFRKKPVVIEAVQIPPADDPFAWGKLAGFMNQGKANWEMLEGGKALAIETLEGTMRGETGDWIIRGVKGEFYPCRDDIFQATYEKVDDAS